MTDERRRFFRIDDEAEVSFKVISDDEYLAWSDNQDNSECEKLAKLEADLSMSIAQLKSYSPQLAKVCELLNSKLDLVMKSNSNTQELTGYGELKTVNLSACGIAFETDEKLHPNEYILLQLKLKPSGVSLITTGQVIDSSSKNNSQIVRIDFKDLTQCNQDLLIQHLFQVQRRSVKKKLAE